MFSHPLDRFLQLLAWKEKKKLEQQKQSQGHFMPEKHIYSEQNYIV